MTICNGWTVKQLLAADDGEAQGGDARSPQHQPMAELLFGELQTLPIAAARVESGLPTAYRLVRRGDGNGNMLPVLQGMFTWTQGKEFGREWRDLETQDEPYVEDHIPFG